MQNYITRYLWGLTNSKIVYLSKQGSGNNYSSLCCWIILNLEKKVPDFTRPKTQPQMRTLPQAPQVQKQQAPAQKGDEITELSESEALFIAKLQSIDVPFDKALEILYEMKRTNGKVPEEKFKEWGFADKAGIAYVELQYKMIREGMTLEQYDYLESNASLSTATSIAITQLARAAMQKVRQRAIERQINAAKNVDTEAAGEGNNESTNKANAAKPDVQQGTAEGVESNKLPNANKVTIDQNKVKNYALDPNHPVGRNKAKVFDSVLGYNQSNADQLIKQLQARLPSSVAVFGVKDQFGQRITVDVSITGPNGNTAIVRTGWILEPGSEIPRMTTIYIK